MCCKMRFYAPCYYYYYYYYYYYLERKCRQFVSHLKTVKHSILLLIYSLHSILWLSGKRWKSLNMISPLFSYYNIIRCNITSIIAGLWMVWYIMDSLWAQENLVEAFIWTLFLQAWWKFLGIYWSSTTVTGYLNLVAEIYNSYIRKLNLLLTNTLTLAVHKSEIVLILIYPQLFYCYYYFFVCFYLNTIYLRIHDSRKNFLQDLWSVFQS